VPTAKLRRPGHGEKLGPAWGIVIAVLYVLTAGLIRWKLIEPRPAEPVMAPPTTDPAASLAD